MRKHRITALMLAFLLALALAPTASSADSVWCIGRYSSYVVYTADNEAASCTPTGSLPPGFSLVKKHNSNEYDFVLEATPTAVGIYDVRFQIVDGSAASYVDMRLIVVPYRIVENCGSNGVAGQYFWYRIPSYFPQASGISFRLGHDPGGNNDDPSEYGLEFLEDGVIRGTPTKAGVCRFRVDCEAIYGGQYIEDGCEVTITIKSAPSTPEPTAAPTEQATPEPTPAVTLRPAPGPTPEPTPEGSELPSDEPTEEPTEEPSPGPAPAPDLVLAAFTDIELVPGAEYDIELISSLGSGEFSGIAGKLPPTLEVVREWDKLFLRGHITEEDLTDDRYSYSSGIPFDGVFRFSLPIRYEFGEYHVRYRVSVPASGGYPAGRPLSVGFGE